MRTSRVICTTVAGCVAMAMLAGCATLQGTEKPAYIVKRIGPKREPLPAGCPIRYEEMELGDAQRLEPQIAFICVHTAVVGHLDPGSEGAIKLVEKEACHLGGDMLTPIGDCHDGSGIGYGVFSLAPPMKPKAKVVTAEAKKPAP